MVPAGWEFESLLWQSGYRVAGVDEAGRGPLAGPVVAAAVIFPSGCDISWLDDSKLLTPKRREEFAAQIRDCALASGWAKVDACDIDSMGLLKATFRAMAEALAQLTVSPNYVLVDGPFLPPQLEVTGQPIVHGDVRCASIAAASILAKVVRDRMMCEFHEQFPQYGFAQHKGYGTAAHLQALNQHGPCPIHRRSFAPVRQASLEF